MDEYYIISNRQNYLIPAMGCLIEFEDVLAKTCEGVIISPTFSSIQNSLIKRYINRLFNRQQINIPINKNSKGKKILIIIVMTIWDCSILYSIPKWRNKFDLVCAYIFDAFFPMILIKNWRYSKFIQLIKLLDYLFIPMSGSLEDFKNTFNIPVAIIPMACDVAKFGSYNKERYIDIIAYGRQLSEHTQILEKHYNAPESNRIYYYTSHMNIDRIYDFYGHRRLFWKLLTNSCISINYNHQLVPSFNKQFNFSFVAQRWFESLTAGCVIIGKRPICAEADQLLNWEDSTIEIPNNNGELIPFIEALFADEKRLNAIHNRNYFYALSRHDWRYRIADMINHLGLTLPTSLNISLKQLKNQCQDFLKLNNIN